MIIDNQGKVIINGVQKTIPGNHSYHFWFSLITEQTSFHENVIVILYAVSTLGQMYTYNTKN